LPTTNDDEELVKAFKEQYHKKYFSGDKLNFLKCDPADQYKKKSRFQIEENELIQLDCSPRVACPTVTLDSEKNWKRKPKVFRDEVKALIDQNDVVYLEGSAGTGKSYLTQVYSDKTLYVVPLTDNRGDNFAEKKVSVTFDTFFDSKLGRGQNTISEKPQSNISMFGHQYKTSDFQVIVFDEIGLLNMTKLSRMVNFIRENKRKFKFILSGDFWQNPPIGEDLNYIGNKESWKESIIKSVCNVTLKLTVNKRDPNKENKEHYEMISTLNRQNDLKGMVQYAIQNCKTIDRLEDIPDCIEKTYCNTKATLRMFSNLYHKGRGYYTGLNLIYKHDCTYIGKGDKKMRFFQNGLYTISKVERNMISLFYVHTPKDIIVLPLETVKSHFILPYGNTWYSKQGGTISHPVLIDLSEVWMFPSPRKLYTNFSRVPSWDYIHLFIDKSSTLKKDLSKMISSMISGHERADFAKNRKYDPKDYIDEDWFMEKLQNTSCRFCNRPFEIEGGNLCFSADRIENCMSHTKKNCRLVHRWCNVVKR
jgi:hypothetical protein